MKAVAFLISALSSLLQYSPVNVIAVNSPFLQFSEMLLPNITISYYPIFDDILKSLEHNVY